MRKRRMSDDYKVFVMIGGRMGLPPSQMGEPEGEACLERNENVMHADLDIQKRLATTGLTS